MIPNILVHGRIVCLNSLVFVGLEFVYVFSLGMSELYLTFDSLAPNIYII